MNLFLGLLIVNIFVGNYRVCEIHSLALDGFNLNTVHKLSSKVINLSAELGFEPGASGWEARMLPLCYAAPL